MESAARWRKFRNRTPNPIAQNGVRSLTRLVFQGPTDLVLTRNAPTTRCDSRLRAFAAMILATTFASAMAQPEGGTAPPVEAAETAAAPAQPERPQASPARAFLLDDLTLVPDDYWAAGTFGDYVLKNDRCTLIFGGMNPKKPNPERDGLLIDAFPGPRSHEHFWRSYPIIGDVNTRTVETTNVEFSNNEQDGSARLVVTMKSNQYKDLTITTTYVMHRDSSGALATTTYRNNGENPVQLAAIGEFMHWGVMSPFIPSVGFAAAGAVDADAEFIYGNYFDDFFFLMPTEGLMKAKHSLYETRLVYKEAVDVPVDGEVSFSRHLLTSTDTMAPLLGEALANREGKPFGYLSGKIIERAMTPTGVVETGVVANADVLLRVATRTDLPNEYRGRPYMITRTDKNGRWLAAVPPGQYGARVISTSRLYEPPGYAHPVEKGKITAIEEGISPASTLLYEIVDADTQQPIPAKLSFVPLRGTNPPVLGDPGEVISSSMLYSANGRGSIEVPKGNYRVVVSQGVEYNSSEVRVSMTEAKTENIRVELKRAFKPEGWVSADLAVRTSASPDVRTNAETRVISAVAEGLQWIVSADKGSLTDFAPIIQALGLSDKLRSSVGFRTNGDRMPLIGDILIAPVDLCEKPNLAALSDAAAKEKPEEALKALKALCPDALTLLMRPTDERVGFLKAIGGKKELAYVPVKDEPIDFDGIQVWDGKKQEEFTLAYSAYQEYLAHGITRTPFGASNSGGTWNAEPGYPRMYIKSSKTGTTEFETKELIENFKKGLVQVTNGPLIEYTVDGKSPGTLVTASAPDVDGVKRVAVDLKIYGPNWTTISRISVQLNGRFIKQIMIPNATAGTDGGLIFPRKDFPDEGMFNLLISRDGVLEVLAESDPGITQDPINPHHIPTRDIVRQGQRTLALSAPIFIDGDDDGAITLPPYMNKNAVQQEYDNPEDYQPPF